jgi:hypothetical protein
VVTFIAFNAIAVAPGAVSVLRLSPHIHSHNRVCVLMLLCDLKPRPSQVTKNHFTCHRQVYKCRLMLFAADAESNLCRDLLLHLPSTTFLGQPRDTGHEQKKSRTSQGQN